MNASKRNGKVVDERAAPTASPGTRPAKAPWQGPRQGQGLGLGVGLGAADVRLGLGRTVSGTVSAIGVCVRVRA